MILLDTNVISQALRPGGASKVVAWIDAQAVETLYLSTITLAELYFGIAAMQSGKRQEFLRFRLEERMLPVFGERVLPFGVDATRVYGELRARARSAGKAVSVADGYIAAIAAARGLVVATRDTSPFEAVGVGVINPWN